MANLYALITMGSVPSKIKCVLVQSEHQNCTVLQDSENLSRFMRPTCIEWLNKPNTVQTANVLVIFEPFG